MKSGSSFSGTPARNSAGRTERNDGHDGGRGEARGLFLRVSGPRSRIEGELESELGRTVQAVTLNTAPPDLVHRILRDGRLVHETDPSRRIRFEVAARSRYLDLLPVLNRYRRRERTPT